MSKSKIKDKKIEVIEKQNQEIQNETVEFILQGYRFSEVLEYLEITYNLEHQQAKYFYDQAKNQILLLGDFDLDMLITQHVIYYEEAIRYFDEVSNYSAKAAAMNAKEKLLKLFEQDQQNIEIENNVDVSIDTEQLYKIEKLNTEEQNRFNQLLSKVQHIK